MAEARWMALRRDNPLATAEHAAESSTAHSSADVRRMLKESALVAEVKLSFIKVGQTTRR